MKMTEFKRGDRVDLSGPDSKAAYDEVLAAISKSQGSKTVSEKVM